MENRELTPEQELLMSAIIEEWVKVPFDTSFDEKAEAAINLTYESAGENKPKKIVWFNNPSDFESYAHNGRYIDSNLTT